MVMETVIVGVLALIGNLVGVYFSNRKNNAIIVYRIDELETKVNKHNNLVERTYEIEKRLEVDDERITVMNHRIKDLEDKE